MPQVLIKYLGLISKMTDKQASYAEIIQRGLNEQTEWRVELAKISVFLLVEASFAEIAKEIKTSDWKGKVDAIIPSGKGKWRLTFHEIEECNNFYRRYKAEGYPIGHKIASVVRSKATRTLHVEAENPLAPKMEILAILKQLGDIQKMEKVMNNGFWTGLWIIWSEIQLPQRSITLKGRDYRVKVVDRAWRNESPPTTPHLAPNNSIQEVSPNVEVQQTVEKAIEVQKTPESIQEANIERPQKVQAPKESNKIQNNNEETETPQEVDGTESSQPEESDKQREAQGNPKKQWIQQPITLAFQHNNGKSKKQEKRQRKLAMAKVVVAVQEIPEKGLQEEGTSSEEEEERKRSASNRSPTEERTATVDQEDRNAMQSPPSKKTKPSITTQGDEEAMEDIDPPPTQIYYP